MAERFLPLMAVDLGNTQAKLGFYPPETLVLFSLFASTVESTADMPPNTATPTPSPPSTRQFPAPAWIRTLRNDVPLDMEFCHSLPSSVQWVLASVNRPAATRLINWLRLNRPNDRILMPAATDLPIPVALPYPDRVGIDRLIDAFAADSLRTPSRPAVIVDAGSAVTIDFLSIDGVFRGGAILPGMQMAARAMHQFTDLLPLLEMPNSLDAMREIPVIGRSTEEAMRSGLFHGTIGAIREIATAMADASTPSVLNPAPPEIFLTGGTGEIVATLLGDFARYDADLTLAGISLLFLATTHRS